MDSKPSKMKVAVVQASPVILNREATLEKVSSLCKEAARGGAELVLFPEAFVSCYPRGTNFGAVIGSRSPEGRELYRLYWESSVDIPGPAIDQLGKMAKENKVHLVIGIIEREGGTLYCTIVFFDDLGTYLGKHRKLMPTAAERVVWGFGDGSTISVFDTKLGKIGAVICWENYMPMLRMTMYSKGIQIYCAPTADSRESWIPTMRHIAVEGRCFVLSSNQFVKLSDYPKEFQPDFGTSDPNYITCRGGSCIVNPFGEILSGPFYNGETILFADLDMQDIIRGKFDFDPVGHYSRPDVFTLYVQEGQNQAVVGTNFKPQLTSGGGNNGKQAINQGSVMP